MCAVGAHSAAFLKIAFTEYAVNGIVVAVRNLGEILPTDASMGSLLLRLHETGQPPPIKEQSVSFALPNSNQTITWKSEYGEDVGRANFDLLAVHVLSGTPYIVATPNLCLSYNKWGRPNPPYVFFKFDGKTWQRIPLSKFPAELQTVNVVVDTLEDQDKLASLGFVSAEKIKELNSDIRLPEYRTILREPLPQSLINSMCEERIDYKGNWILPNDPIARQFIDQQKK